MYTIECAYVNSNVLYYLCFTRIHPRLVPANFLKILIELFC